MAAAANNFMKIHRFIIENFSLTEAQLVLIEPGIVKQITKVLKLQSGEQVIISDGRGREILAEILTLEKNKILLKNLGEQNNIAEPAVKVFLYCSLLRRENFELACQKAVEAGVHKIIPILTERTVKLGYKPERCQKIIKEAAEQCGRSSVPILAEAQDFAAALQQAQGHDFALFFALEKKPLITDQAAIEKIKNSAAVGLFIGPEGGWSEEELQAAVQAGLWPAGLGSLVLRAETAALIATYLTNSLS